MGKKEPEFLNLADAKAKRLRENMVELVKDGRKDIMEVTKSFTSDRHDIRSSDVNLKRLGAVLVLVYREIDNFEDLMMLRE